MENLQSELFTAIVIFTIVQILWIIGFIFLMLTIYKLRKRNKELSEALSHSAGLIAEKAISNLKPYPEINGLVLQDQYVELALAHRMQYVFHKDYFNTFHKVFTNYYNELKEMVVLMYEMEVGFVLVHENGQGEPKFYHLHKVHAGIPQETMVKGYIQKGEGEEIFVITGRVNEDSDATSDIFITDANIQERKKSDEEK